MGLFDGVVSDHRRQELLRSGIAARATVTGIKSLGRTSSAGMLTELTLQVEPPAGRPFARTVREWLSPAVESSLTIGAPVSVRYSGKTVVLEATGDSGMAGGQATWVPPPLQPSGSWAPPTGQGLPPGATVVSTTFSSTTLSGPADAQAVADALQAALERLPGLMANPVVLAAQAQAPATILGVTDTAQQGGMTVSSVGLRVEPPGEPPFEVTTTITFSSPEHRAQFSPGRTLRVRYDPNNHHLVLVIPGTVS
jgi:hypothetical protein